MTRLLIAFALVQAADMATTTVILRFGGWESNPLLSSFGPHWWVPKLALAGLALWLLSRFRRPWHVAMAVLASAVPVVSNLVVML